MIETKDLVLPLLAGLLTLSGCPDDPDIGDDETGTGETDGDGDGDTTGDGDGDTAGDGDGDGDTGGDGDGDEPPEPMGEVRVFHGSPDAPPVDVYVEGSDTPVIEGLGYTQASAYLELPVAEYNFQVYAAGAEPSPENLVIETGPVSVEDLTRYTVSAMGLLEPVDDDGPLMTQVYVEAFEEVAADTVRARIVHAGADAPLIDIDLYDGSVEGSCEEEIEIIGVERFGETGAEGVELPALDGLNLAICFEGQTIQSFTLDLEALSGAELFVFADGLLDQNIGREVDALRLLTLAADTEGDALSTRRDPFVYVLHSSPDVGVVDLCINDNGIPPLQNLAIGDLVGPFRFNHNANIPFTLHSDPGGETCAGEGVPFDLDMGALPRGSTSIVAAAGAVQLDNLSQQVFTEGFDLTDVDNVRIRAVHLSPDTPEIDVGIIGEGFGVFTDLAYPGASEPEGASIVPQEFTFQAGLSMAPGEDADVAVVNFGPLELEDAAGARFFNVITGMLEGENALPMALFLVRTDLAGDFMWSLEGLLGSTPPTP